MKRRMNNIFRKDGKSFVLAMDHSAQMYSPDLKDPSHIIRECVAGGVDAFLTTYGIIKHFSDDFGNAGIIMRADGGASMIRKPQSPLELLYTAEDAVRVGADAMLCMGLPGSQNNEHSLKYLARLAADCERYNLPVCSEALPYGFERPEGIDTRAIDLMSFACRQSVDLGADFIKSEFVGGEAFRRSAPTATLPFWFWGAARQRQRRTSSPISARPLTAAQRASSWAGILSATKMLHRSAPPSQPSSTMTHPWKRPWPFLGNKRSLKTGKRV